MIPIKPHVFYNLPGRKTYYTWSGTNMSYTPKDNAERHLFKYFNKFGEGFTWKDDTFVAQLIESPKSIQVLFGQPKP